MEKKMTPEEADAIAKEEIAKIGYERYRKLSYSNVSEDTGHELPHRVQYELLKHDGDPVALFKARPDLYEPYRRSMWVKVGPKVKD
jgi:hypothetical protein